MPARYLVLLPSAYRLRCRLICISCCGCRAVARHLELVGFWCWHLLARGACVSAPSFRRGAATGRFRGFCGSRLELPSRDGPFGPRFRTRPRQFAAARQQMQVSQLTEPFRFSLFHRYPSACIQNTMRDTETEALHNLRTPSLGPVFH